LGERVDAVILAGGEPDKADPLVEYAQVQKKALIQIAGKEMARYVVEAIAGSSQVGRIFIVGLSPEDGVEFATPVEYVEAAGSMLDNIVAGMERVTEVDPDVERVIVSSADIPLVTTEMVDYFIDTCLETDHDRREINHGGSFPRVEEELRALARRLFRWGRPQYGQGLCHPGQPPPGSPSIGGP
jgi:molybdopterin-guanine dinucleotide biosynthesis protein A